ncbi:ppdK, partial [Symbiodinium sp. CCMP2456]
SAMTKWVHNFGPGEEGATNRKDLLGNKGAHLAEMASIGLPVPPGFTLTTEVCNYFQQHGVFPEGLKDEVLNSLALVEQRTGMKFGDSTNPLLVSVRSGAPPSMPGMMDTVLNVGLNSKTVQAMSEKYGDPRFSLDTYRRFIQNYADVVLGLDVNFEEILRRAKQRRGVKQDYELEEEDLEKLVRDYKTRIYAQLGQEFPTDPLEQLWGAISAVFKSWSNPRARTYRELHDIPDAWGTAANIQAMVFGNMGNDCATGVAFTRNPSTGDNHFFGEFLVNAQGEDVVAGIRTPRELTTPARLAHGGDLPSLEELMPKMFRELMAVREQLEKHYRDMHEIEFTIQKGKLYMLQTRAGKRTTPAAIRIAVDMANEGFISREEAIMRLKPQLLEHLLHPTFDPTAQKKVITKGLPASPGAAAGKVVFCADEVWAMEHDLHDLCFALYLCPVVAEQAVRRANDGERVILVRSETSPDDIHGLHAAQGVLTITGGITSHAAVVARGMGRPCVVGAGRPSGAGAAEAGAAVDLAARTLRVGDVVVKEGDRLSIDGVTGEVMLGEVPTMPPTSSVLGKQFQTLMSWTDLFRSLQVRANAETIADTRQAKEFGAEGLGLVRTEHMFFAGRRIVAVRQMILASDQKERKEALHKLLFMQREDMVELFEIMSGLPVTIRLLDPPLHEFLPHTESELAAVARAAGMPLERLKRRANEIQESNPMLGHRGCRLAITYPEICEMQARAIFGAAAQVKNCPMVEVMVPLVASLEEFKTIKEIIDKTAQAVQAEEGVKLHYGVGSMIELPRACLQAGRLAEQAEFFSFGTNDLTQTTYGLSRDDVGNFMSTYKAKGVMEEDPFVSIDEQGVGELMKLAMKRGQKTRAGIEMGICGEHGGDPSSIEFCQRLGLDYVSCSPYRVPIARLAAAQAALKDKGFKAKAISTKAAKPLRTAFGPW